MSKLIKRILRSDRGIKDLLIEMKDLSEIAVDLAYSALIYNSKEIAEEVTTIEEQINEMALEVETRSVLACPGPAGLDPVVGAMRVSRFISRITDAAKLMADIVLREAEVGSFISEVFKKTEESVTKIMVRKGSRLTAMTPDELMEGTGADIAAIKRGSKWSFYPEKGKFEAGDVLIVKGWSKGLERVKGLNR